MTQEEREAVEWVRAIKNSTRPGSDAERHAATAIRMLSRPALPEEPSEAALNAMMAAIVVPTAPWDKPGAAYPKMYRALYAHLTKPRTKEATVWRVEWAFKDPHTGCWRPAGRNEATEVEANKYAQRLRDGAISVACISVTGPHLQSIPDEGATP
jgi:hypothetical protein